MIFFTTVLMHVKILTVIYSSLAIDSFMLCIVVFYPIYRKATIENCPEMS